jgi:antitoxin component YwqK of YwqJK toxin-antitoxin module
MDKRYYKNGKREGQYILNYENGKFMEKCYFKNGKR